MAYLETDSNLTLGNGGNGNNAWGSDWIAILLIFAIFGRGFGNFGGFGGNGGGVADGYVLASDFANIERKIDGVNNGLCDGFYAQNTNMLNGFSGVQSTLCQGFSGINTALVQQGYETRLGINGLQNQMASCCCDLKSGLADIKYAMATDTCSIIQAGKDNTQRLVDLLTAQTIEAKNDRIAQQQATINALQLKASQEAQTNTILNAVNRTPSPAYVVPNPYCCNAYTCGSAQ